MKSYLSLFLLPAFLVTPLTAEQAVSEKALRYHEALLKRPQNSTLLDRFFSAWIDEQPIETLDTFLKERAEKHGGQDLAILAQHQLRRGLEDDALQTLGKAIAALPDESYLLMERAKILLRRLDFEPARTDLEKVTQGKDPQLSLEASKLIGKSWLREGNSAQAIETWDKLLAAHPGDEDLLEDLVESAASEGEIDQALTYIQKLIQASSDPYKKTLRQLRQGDLLAQADRHDDAIKAYSDTFAQVGEGSWLEREILAQIDKAFRKQDRLNDLKEKFIELAEAHPRRLLIHRQLAKLEADQGDVDSAVGRFREVLKRTPGNQELREEFIRLLTDSEKFDDASEEINKLIALAPDNTSLLFQLADLQHRQNNKEASAATLEKALKLLGPDENSGIRIASLMLQYGLNPRGEEILKNLSAAENATSAPAETLASHYARSHRKPEAIAIFKKIGEAENLEVLLRAASSISALGETKTAFDLLTQSTGRHDQDPRFLSAIAQAALSSEKPDDAVKHAIRLVRISKQTNDIAQSIELALRAIMAADQAIQWQDTLEKQPAKSPAETCLLAALSETMGDFDQVESLLSDNPDPTVIRFHVVILQRRGEWDKAIAVLTRLADTDEGRKTSYFKDLSDLQRNAGLTEDALATIERWKQSAPTDKTPWIIGSSILRENARTDQAVQMVRQAVARFKEDIDLSANLAQLHEEASQMEEARSIYWQLYDNAENPAEQARWATNLAKIASQTGRIQELEEKLRERARNNRRSIGPLLAQAELARFTQNEDKRRDLLLEAVRLQPTNIDLRLQIANLEEESGNPDRVIAILEEAVAADTTGRIRNSLAQAYLRQGQTLKGMRELQRIAGTQGNDPRIIESNAASLASSGLYDEAIRYMRETLPTGGDWRSQYLFATLLEQDGRESEAIPLFLPLLQTTEEIPSLTAISKRNQDPDHERYWDRYPKATQKIMQLMGAGQAAYMHRNSDRSHYYHSSSSPGMTKVGSFILPDNTDTLRSLTAIHLAKIHPKAVENAAFINDLIGSGSMHETNLPALLQQHPDYPGLFELALVYSQWNEENLIDDDILREQLAKNKSLTDFSRFQIYMHLIRDAEPNDPAWQGIVATTEEIAKSDKSEEVYQLAYLLMNLLFTKSETAPELPEPTKKSLSNILIDLASKDLPDHDYMGGFKLMAIHGTGTRQQWIDAVNETVKSFPEDIKKKSAVSPRSMRYSSSHHYFHSSDTSFSLPKINRLSLRSLPSEVINLIQPARSREGHSRYDMPDPKDLISHLNEFESPTLRLWIAICAEDQEAINKALTATPPGHEASDFKTLQAFHALTGKDYPTAYKLFAALRPAYSSDRNLIQWLNFSLIAIANEMKEEDRANLTEDLRALLIQCRAHLGLQGADAIAAQADKFGMPDLAKRFSPKTFAISNTNAARPGGAVFGSRRTSSSSSGGNASIDKMKKFASEGKLDAAALEALNLVRKANQSTYSRFHEINQIKESIPPDVLTKLLEISHPGSSQSLTKRLEYADICTYFGKQDAALEVLAKLHEERPEDLQITAKLAFLLPPDQQDQAIKLMSLSASHDEFVNIAQGTAEYLSDAEDNTASFRYFSTIAAWLQSADPKELADVNITWVGYNAQQFFQGRFTDDLPALTEEKPDDIKESKSYTEYVGIAERLANAMLRHPSIAEEGFRLLGASHAWKIEDAQRDEQARQLFLITTIKPQSGNTGFSRHTNYSYFSFITSNGSSSGSGDLEQHASVKWISDRVAAAKSPDDVLSPAYLKQLREHDTAVGDLVAALANLTTIKQLDTYWKSDLFTKTPGPFPLMCRNAILARASLIPESTGFFIDRINELNAKSIEEARYNSSNLVISLFNAALISASNQDDPAILTKTCTAISKKLFGDEINLNSSKDSRKIYSAISLIESMIGESNLKPVDSIRIHNALYKLGIPAGRYSHQITRSFHNINIKNESDAVKIFNSFGWLNDIDTWEPFSAIIVETNHSGNEIQFIRKDEFMTPEVIRYMNVDVSSSQIAAHLEKLKPQTFGNLITAACLTSGDQRSALTEKAFKLAATKLSTISLERAKSFDPLLSWLPDSAIDTLPEAFQESLGRSKTEKLAKLSQDADAFLKSAPLAGNHRSPLDQVERLVADLAPLDLGKAVAVFLEAERRFTHSLSRGGRISSYTSNGLQITERDESLQDILLGSSTLGPKPDLSLAFYKAIASSPEASRFSFASPEKFTPILFRIGQNINRLNQANNQRFNPIVALRNVDTLPANVKNDTYYALGIAFIGDQNRRGSVKLPQHRTELNQAKDLPELAYHIHALSIGVSKWKDDSPEGRMATRKAFVFLSNFPDVAPTTRFQLLFVSCYMAPDIFTDNIIAESFTKAFEDYAAADRSVINSVGLYSSIVISMAPATEQTRPFFSRINHAFWQNANAAKSGGHPNIPEDLAPALLMSTAAAHDEANTKKLLHLARPGIIGNANAIFALVTHGYHELAKQNLCPLNKFHPIPRSLPAYHSHFEKQYAEFRKTPGINPISLIRLDALFLDLCPAAEGENKASESFAERETRIIASYLANPPTDLMLRTEIVSRLIRDSHTAAIALHDEVLAIRDQLDLQKALDDWGKGSGDPSDLIPRYIIAPAESVIFRQAAFLQLLDGDASALSKLADTVISQPKSIKSARYGNSYYNREYASRISTSAPIWIIEAVHLGKTSAFTDAYEPFAKLAVHTDNSKSSGSTNVRRFVTVAEFLAFWNGQPKSFNDTRRQIKNYANYFKYLDQRKGLINLCSFAREHRTWSRESFANTRHNFLIKIFSKPEMAPYLGHSHDLISQTANSASLKEALLKIAATPPDTLTPQAATHLLGYYAHQEFAAKRFDSGVAYSIKAIESCPSDGPWKDIHFRSCISLIERLIKAEQIDRAKQIHAMIKTETLNPNQRKRCDEFAKKLEPPAE